MTPTANVTLLIRSLTVAALLLGSSAARAESEGLYFGLSIGQSKSDLDENEINGVFLDAFPTIANASLAGSNLDDTDGAFGVQVGYRFNPYLALEVGYIDLGTADQSAEVDTIAGTFTGRTEFTSSGPTFALVGGYPFAERFEVYGRGGLYISDTRTSSRLNDPTGEEAASIGDKGSDTDLFAGIGVGWNISERFSLRLDLQRYLDVGDDAEADVDVISLGVVFR